MVEFLGEITDIHFSLYPSSWGRLQCIAETADGKRFYAWAGRPENPLTRELFADALDLIEEQIGGERNKSND